MEGFPRPKSPEKKPEPSEAEHAPERSEWSKTVDAVGEAEANKIRPEKRAKAEAALRSLYGQLKTEEGGQDHGSVLSSIEETDGLRTAPPIVKERLANEIVKYGLGEKTEGEFIEAGMLALGEWIAAETATEMMDPALEKLQQMRREGYGPGSNTYHEGAGA